MTQVGAQVKTSDAALVARGISKHFGGVHALSDVSLEAPAGRVTGLIGPNGAGKSTLLKIISGFVKPDTGSVTLGGAPVSFQSPGGTARAGLVTTFQQATPVRGLTVLENVLVGLTKDYPGGVFATLAALPKLRSYARSARSIALQLLEDFHLADVAGEDAGNLSFGQLRFLEVARALATKPRVLLLDEPAAGLNRVEIDHLSTLIKRLRTDTDIGLVVVDHDVPFVFDLCDQITAMNFGRVIATGTPSEIESDEHVRSAYLSVT